METLEEGSYAVSPHRAILTTECTASQSRLMSLTRFLAALPRMLGLVGFKAFICLVC